MLVNPCFEAPTAEMRAVLPKEVPMKQVGLFWLGSKGPVSASFLGWLPAGD